MALFKKEKKNTEKEVKKESAASESKKVKNLDLQNDLSWVIIRPRVTEKGAILSGISNAYPFEVHKDANKKLISESIQSIYKVTPKKIRIVKVMPKTVRRKGGVGVKKGGKKAYVYLKKGDKIEFV